MLPLPVTIERLTESNTAGACKLQFIRVEDVSAVPEEILGTIATAITLVGSAAWYTVVPTLYTQDFDEDYSNEGGAQKCIARMSVIVPKSRVSLHAGLYGLKPGRYLVLNHDRNGTVKLLGTLDEPAQVRCRELAHGKDPYTDRNQYVIDVVSTRTTPCPFYLADPPAPGTPDDCPTLPEMLSGMSWSEIESELSGPQLAAAEASLCDVCSTLCELVDEAIILPIPGPDGMTVSGAGDSDFNGFFEETGTANGRPRYEYGTAYLEWFGSFWWMTIDGSTGYRSLDDEATPDLCTTWIVINTTPTPLPTVTEGGGGGTPGDASTLTDCLSPEQEAVLLEALGGSEIDEVEGGAPDTDYGD